MRGRDRVHKLLESAGVPLNALDVCQITKTGPRTVLPELDDMERRGVVEATWVFNEQIQRQVKCYRMAQRYRHPIGPGYPGEHLG